MVSCPGKLQKAMRPKLTDAVFQVGNMKRRVTILSGLTGQVISDFSNSVYVIYAQREGRS